MAQSVKRPTLAQVMLSQFVSSIPALGSMLTTRSLEPASDSVSPSLSAPLPLVLSFSKINIKKNCRDLLATYYVPENVPDT